MLDEQIPSDLILISTLLSILGCIYIISIFVFRSIFRTFAFKLVVCLNISDLLWSSTIFVSIILYKIDETRDYCKDRLYRNIYGILRVFSHVSSDLQILTIAYILYQSIIKKKLRKINASIWQFFPFFYGIPAIIATMY